MKWLRMFLMVVAVMLVAACQNKAAEAPNRVGQLKTLCVRADGQATVPAMVTYEANLTQAQNQWSLNQNGHTVGALIERGQMGSQQFAPRATIDSICGGYPALQTRLDATATMKDGKDAELTAIWDAVQIDLLNAAIKSPFSELDSARQALNYVNGVEWSYRNIQQKGLVSLFGPSPSDPVTGASELLMARSQIDSLWQAMASSNWGEVNDYLTQAPLNTILASADRHMSPVAQSAQSSSNSSSTGGGASSGGSSGGSSGSSTSGGSSGGPKIKPGATSAPSVPKIKPGATAAPSKPKIKVK